MEWFEALILGVLQGLTEYLPVSSSGHLAIGSALFGIQGEDNLTFTIAVHVATVLSTLVILWKEIGWIFRGLFKFEMNAETKYVINILVSMIPIGIVGVFFKDYVEEIFGSGLLIVGCMLLLTALLLAFSYYAKPRLKENISMKDAFIIGLAQACAVMPGLSRSGTTIATGLLLGDNKAKLAQFSFSGLSKYNTSPSLKFIQLHQCARYRNGTGYGTIDSKINQLTFLHNINHPLTSYTARYESCQKTYNQ
jgi:undecaprenyl-diphosphatase